MSLRWLLSASVCLLLVPASLAQAPTEVAAKAPLDLFGDVDLQGPLVSGLHCAFEDGTMAGIVYRGTLVRLVQEEGRPSQRTVVAEVDPDQPFEFSLAAGAVATLSFPQGFRFFVGPSGIPQDDHPVGQPVAIAGPNPARTVDYDEDAGVDPFLHMPVIPWGQFLVAPTGGVNTTSPFLLTLEAGNLTFGPAGEDAQRYEAAVRAETRNTGFPVIPANRDVRVLTTYELNATRVVYSLRQEGAEAPQAYWTDDGHLPAADSKLPTGHRLREEAGAIQGILRDHGLPATVLVTDAPAIGLDGVVRIRPTDTGSELLARRGLVGGEIDMGGVLQVSLDGASDAQRRMVATVTGSVVWTSGPEAAVGDEKWRSTALVAGGGLLLAAGLAWSWPMLKLGLAKFLVTPLYARIHRDEVLEHPVRDDILTMVTREPGISATELGKRAECGWGTLVYHLSVLERERLLWSAREGRHRRYFAQGRVNYSDRDALGLLRNPASRRLADAVKGAPGIIQKDLSRVLELAPSTVAWHVDRLVRAGLVVKESDGRQVRYFPSQRLDQLAHATAAA